MNTRALTLLNEQGDVTIIWTEDRDAEMEAIIEKKMAEGIVFFIIEPRFGGAVAPAKTELRDSADARRYRALAVRDEDFARFVGAGAGEVVGTPAAPVRRARKSKAPAEIARAESVGVRQRRGG